MADITSAPSDAAVSNGNTAPPTSNGTSQTMATSTVPGLSADEIALYDRQIRLWGAQAQERIRSAHILLISLRALGTEIAKNLTLAGINSLTLIDDDVVTEEDLGTQYFVREEDVGKSRTACAIPRIQELNPRVNVVSGCSFNDLLGKDPTFYSGFDCVIACDHDFTNISMINTAVRFANRPFYAAAIHGFYGYIFADLAAHEFMVERDKSNVAAAVGAETLTRAILGVSTKKDNNGKTIEILKKQEVYCPLILANSSPLPMDVLGNRRKLRSVPALLPCLRALFDFQRNYSRLPGHTAADLGEFTRLATTKSRELQLPPETLKAEFLRSFIQNIGAEIVPTAAFVGGRLSEDAINVLGKREQPIQNFALFDGDALEGKIYSLYSPPPELTMALEMNGMGGMGDMGGMNGGMAGMNGMPDGMMLDASNFMTGNGDFTTMQGMMPMDMAAMNGGMMTDTMNNGFGTGLDPANNGMGGLQGASNVDSGATGGPSATASGATGSAGPTSAPANTGGSDTAAVEESGAGS